MAGEMRGPMRLTACPERLEMAAVWFGEKWEVPVEAYRESMQASLQSPDAVPQWYLIVRGSNIIGGAGLIENDFHARKDLRPNLCALYVEPAWRGQGLARRLLDFVRRDCGRMGIPRLYLITDHTAFYEKCGWTFWTMTRGDDGALARVYMAPALETLQGGTD